MNCPYCDNEVPPGVTNCPNCNGPISGNPAVNNPAPVLAVSLSSNYAWILALLPLGAELLLGLLIAMAEPSTEEGAGVIGIIVLLAYLGLNFVFLHQDEKLLATANRRDEMLLFMRTGLFFAPVYLVARAAKIDKNWAYAIVGSLTGLYWWWGWIF